MVPSRPYMATSGSGSGAVPSFRVRVREVCFSGWLVGEPVTSGVWWLVVRLACVRGSWKLPPSHVEGKSFGEFGRGFGGSGDGRVVLYRTVQQTAGGWYNKQQSTGNKTDGRRGLLHYIPIPSPLALPWQRGMPMLTVHFVRYAGGRGWAFSHA